LHVQNFINIPIFATHTLLIEAIATSSGLFTHPLNNQIVYVQ